MLPGASAFNGKSSLSSSLNSVVDGDSLRHVWKWTELKLHRQSHPFSCLRHETRNCRSTILSTDGAAAVLVLRSSWLCQKLAAGLQSWASSCCGSKTCSFEVAVQPAWPDTAVGLMLHTVEEKASESEEPLCTGGWYSRPAVPDGAH